MRSLVPCVALSLALVTPAPVAPDFSGRWKFDADKSLRLAQEAKGYTAGILGEQCVITQTVDALTMNIAIGTLKVEAIYRLDGKPITNTSPGRSGQPDIPIVSTTQWVGETLNIVTKSESELDGVKVPVESLRKIWLTAEGDLAVERRGTPTRVVSDAWSVYLRIPAGPAKNKADKERAAPCPPRSFVPMCPL